MSVVKSLLRYCTDGDYRFLFNLKKGAYTGMPDEEFLRRRFHAARGVYPNLENPRSFSEKLQWLKLHDRNPAYTALVDKAAVKPVIADKIGQQYLIPTLGVWDTAEEIDFGALPDRFVLKCTHDSHGVILCRSKAQLDIAATRAKLQAALGRSYYLAFREWPYKDVKPRVIAEPFITDDGQDLTDYKVHCFNGEPRLVLVCGSRYSGPGLREDFFDEAWHHLPVKRPKVPNAETEPPRPPQLEEMLRLARVLSEGIPFVRVDFYTTGGQVLFGEMTFYPASGFTRFEPDSWDDTFGSWLRLPR